MTTRTVDKFIKATEVSEGAGVTVHRTIGTPALRNLDPFLMLDFFSSDDPDDYIAGFPDHPHRGFNTFTYMLDGHLLHQDSMGNKGNLKSGGAQWMKAASGVIHSEMPQQENGLMRGFQLWVNLPAAEKMSEPGYQEFSDAAFPVVSDDGVRVKVLMGEYEGSKGPVQDPNTDVRYFDVSLGKAKIFRVNLAEYLVSFVYLFEGTAKIQGMLLPEHSFAVLGTGDSVEIVADEPARFILVAGKPLNEPIVQYGPFVMNTEEEIRKAFQEYQNGTLVRDKATMVVG